MRKMGKDEGSCRVWVQGLRSCKQGKSTINCHVVSLVIIGFPCNLMVTTLQITQSTQSEHLIIFSCASTYCFNAQLLLFDLCFIRNEHWILDISHVGSLKLFNTSLSVRKIVKLPKALLREYALSGAPSLTSGSKVISLCST